MVARLDGQRIHIGAQSKDGAPEAEIGCDARLGHRVAIWDAQVIQLLSQIGAGFGFLESQLWYPMQCPAPMHSAPSSVARLRLAAAAASRSAAHGSRRSKETLPEQKVMGLQFQKQKQSACLCSADTGGHFLLLLLTANPAAAGPHGLLPSLLGHPPRSVRLPCLRQQLLLQTVGSASTAGATSQRQCRHS